MENSVQSKIDELIIKGEVKSALEFIREEFAQIDLDIADEVLLTLSKIIDLEKRQNLNLLSYQEYNTELSKITYSAISFKQKLRKSSRKDEEKWDLKIVDEDINKPRKIKGKRVLIKGEITINSSLKFNDCRLRFEKAKIEICRSAKIEVSNSFVLLNKVSLQGVDSIGDDLKISNSEVQIVKSNFVDINRIEISNSIEGERKIEFTKCVFSNFNHLLLLENASDEYVVIDNCVFNEFLNGGLYFKCRNSYVQKTVFSECQRGISVLMKDDSYSTAISNCTFSEMKDAGIELWIYSEKSKSVINDVTFSECGIGVHANIKQEEESERILGEIDIEETVIVSNYSCSNCATNIKVDKIEKESLY